MDERTGDIWAEMLLGYAVPLAPSAGSARDLQLAASRPSLRWNSGSGVVNGTSERHESLCQYDVLHLLHKEWSTSSPTERVTVPEGVAAIPPPPPEQSINETRKSASTSSIAWLVEGRQGTL